MEQNIILLALNGVLTLTVSMLAGRWYAKAILTNGNDVAWRVVHSGGSMGGIMLVAFASVLSHTVLSDFWRDSFTVSIISGTWLFILGMFAAAISGHRGLHSAGSRRNKLVYTAYLGAAALSLLGCIILIAGLVNAL